MNDSRPLLPEACAEARQTIHELLDGPIPADSREALAGHLSSCDSCREFQRGVEAVQTALQELPELPFPDDALEEVWSRTVHAKPEAPAVPAPRPGWWSAVAAAAAILLLAVLVSLNQNRVITVGPEIAGRGPGEVTPAEIEQAALEARQVLALTAQALRKGRRVALEEVLAGQVSPAIRRIPIQWPRLPAKDSRRSKT